MTDKPKTERLSAIFINDENEQTARMRRLVIAFSCYLPAFLCKEKTGSNTGLDSGIIPSE